MDTWLSQRVVKLVSLFEYLNIFSTFIIPESAIFNTQFPDHVLEAYKFCVKSPSSHCLYSVNRTIYPIHPVVTRLILFMGAIVSGCTSMPIQKARDTINAAVLPVGICCSFWFPHPLTGLLL